MITILANAHKRFNELTEKNRKVFVRLSVKGGGCAGFNYDWSFENEKGPDDVLVDGILLVDKQFELYVIGMELDTTKRSGIGNYGWCCNRKHNF